MLRGSCRTPKAGGRGDSLPGAGLSALKELFIIEIMELSPHVTLRCFRDTRFKQGCLSFQLVGPMEREHIAYNALLPAVLLRGTKTCPDLRAITQRLDTLYGAAVGPMVRRIGDYQTTGLYCSFMDERFALPGDQVLAPMLEFLEELLLDPVMENDGFSAAFVDSEKKNLISTIESERNDKRTYALSRLLEEMCRGDSFGLPRLGKPEDVEKVDPVGLYSYYQELLRTAPIEIFYVGSAESGHVAQLLRPLLARISREPRGLPEQTALHPAPGQDLTERMDVNQGKLCMGFTLQTTTRDPDFAAAQVFNTIFGGGMTSKLFQNVREKLSLCYYVGSSYYRTKGLMTVSAGIDFDQEQRTREEILRQLDACRAGQITPAELAAAKEALLSSLRATHDSPGAIEGYYAVSALSGMDLTPQAYMDAIRAVDTDQVVRVARGVQLHTTYFLKGGSQ